MAEARPGSLVPFAMLGGAALVLVFHARAYDFVADDAYITFRYARNLVEHGELAYNVGERVEGFTSPLWVFLLALCGSLGAPLPEAAQVLGMLSGVLCLVATYSLFRELEPQASRLLGVAAASFAATSAPLAAWTAGGLETPAFGALITAGIALLAGAWRERTPRRAFIAGLVLALAGLCRPEALVLLVFAVAFAGLAELRLARAARALEPAPAPYGLRHWWLALLGPPVVLLGGYLAFRLAYYGDPLPNTFYVKTSGEGLFERGLAYLRFAAVELGFPFVIGLGVAVALPLLPVLGQGPEREGPEPLSVHGLASVVLAVQLAYVARIGGDFLDLYRFLAPFLPVAFCLIMALVARLGSRFPAHSLPLQLTVVVVLFSSHLERQRSMAREATKESAPSRAALRLEPLGWTRVYAERWAALGRALAAVAKPGDDMAIGAAGAAPYYARMSNVDLFGLNDRTIAREGRMNGNRPGHQRFTTMEYLLARAPTYILLEPENTSPSPLRIGPDPAWARRGYRQAELRVDDPAIGRFYQRLYVRHERALELREHPKLRFHEPRYL